jgi:hypothetical protein
VKCFIVTKAVPDRFKVLPVIENYGWEPTFVCDTLKQKGQLQKLGVDHLNISVSGITGAGITGVSQARDYVAEFLMPLNEWCLWIDDNVERITGIPFGLSEDRLDFDNTKYDWRSLFDQTLSRNCLQAYIDETIEEAERRGTICAGFATEYNYFFRSKKWRYFGYCRTQFSLYKNDGSTWFPFETMMLEDMYKSLDVVARYGQVVINRHLKPVKQQFEAGGIGSLAERLPHQQENCSRLYEMFPGLVKYPKTKEVEGVDADRNHLTFAKISHKTVNKWRKENGYLG